MFSWTIITMSGFQIIFWFTHHYKTFLSCALWHSWYLFFFNDNMINYFIQLHVTCYTVETNCDYPNSDSVIDCHLYFLKYSSYILIAVILPFFGDLDEWHLPKKKIHIKHSQPLKCCYIYNLFHQYLNLYQLRGFISSFSLLHVNIY